MKTLLFFSIFSLLSGLPLTGNWTADASKAKITFTVDGPFGEVHGSFSGLTSDFQFDEKDLSKSSISASIDAAYGPAITIEKSSIVIPSSSGFAGA